jgi:hypothetical protein
VTAAGPGHCGDGLTGYYFFISNFLNPIHIKPKTLEFQSVTVLALHSGHESPCQCDSTARDRARASEWSHTVTVTADTDLEAITDSIRVIESRITV